MVRVNNSVGWVARRSMDTNELHHPEAHGPTLHLNLSDMRHTSQFPHHNASNFCTFSENITENQMVRVNNSVGWVARRSIDTNELHHPEAHGPTIHLNLSDMRHTSQFPQHNASNLCTFSETNAGKGMVPVNKSVG